MWKDIIDAETKSSLKDLIMKIQCLNNRRQHGDLLVEFHERYFEMLPQVVEKRDREFVEVFMQHLSPYYLARDSDLANFQKLLDAASASNAPEFYVLFLKKQIEQIN